MLNKIAAIQNKTATPKSTQKTITIDQELWSELESWLSSKQAKKLGYHSKAQFATEAVRNLLEKYTSGKNIEKEILEHIDVIRRELADYVGIDIKLKLIETLGSSQTKNSDYVENLLQEARETLTKLQNQKAYGEETQKKIDKMNAFLSSISRPTKLVKNVID